MKTSSSSSSRDGAPSAHLICGHLKFCDHLKLCDVSSSRLTQIGVIYIGIVHVYIGYSTVAKECHQSRVQWDEENPRTTGSWVGIFT